MINSIDSAGSVVLAQSGQAVAEWKIPEAASAPKVNRDVPLGAQNMGSTSEDSVYTQGLYGVLRTSKDAVNQVASDIRGLGEAKKLVARVRDNLELIVKSFPPYPPGGLEREQFLNSVAGIRAMIERLTFPPDQSKVISETLSGDAFVNAGASTEALSAGLDRVGVLTTTLGDVQNKLSVGIQVNKINNQAEDAFFIQQSQSVGQVLLSDRLSIGREFRLILGMLN